MTKGQSIGLIGAVLAYSFGGKTVLPGVRKLSSGIFCGGCFGYRAMHHSRETLTIVFAEISLYWLPLQEQQSIIITPKDMI